jgi:hypothetical protein
MEQQCNAAGGKGYQKLIFPACPFDGYICKLQHQGDRQRDALPPEKVQEIVRTILSLFQEGFDSENNTWNLLLTVIVISTYCASEFFNVPIVWLHLPKDFKKEWLLHLLSAISNWPYFARNYFSFNDLKKLLHKSCYFPTVFFVDPKTYDKSIQKCYLENPSERTQFLYDKHNMKEYLYSYRIVLADYPPNFYSNRYALCLELPNVLQYPICDSKRIESIREDCDKLWATFENPLNKAIKKLGEKAPAYSPAFSLYAMAIVLKDFGALQESELKSVCELLEKLEIRSKKNYGYDQDKDVLWLVWDYLAEHTAEVTTPGDIVDGYIILERLTSFMAFTTHGQVLVAPQRISEILNQYNLILDRKRKDLETPPEIEKHGHTKRRIQRTGVIVNKEALQEAISGY